MASPQWPPWATAALVAVAAHVTSLLCGFVWLDHAHIGDGLALAPAGAWGSLFKQGFAGTGFYRPLMSVSLSLDAAGGGAAWLYHASSLLWHAAAAALTVVAASALGLARPSARLAGILFAVHPATSLVAGAIAFRSEAMLTVALLAAIVLHLRNKTWPAAAALFLGALCKETALVLGPLAIAALELSAKRPGGTPGPGPRAPRATLRLLGAEATAIALALALRWAFAPTWRAIHVALPPGEAIGTRLAAFAKSALLVMFPIERSICDAFPITSLLSLNAVAGAVLLGAVAFHAWKRRGPALLLALALLPSLNLVPIMRWWSPHYLYLPLAFAAMLGAEAVLKYQRRGPIVAAVAVAVLGALSLHDDLRFRSDESLWGREVAQQPHCREGHFFLAEQARERKRLPLAEDHYQRAIADAPGFISYVDAGAALQNLGVTQLEQQRFAEARTAFRAALPLVDETAARRKLTHNLATAELRAGAADEAARLLESEVARSDAFPASIFIRARALHVLGREQEARVLVQRLQGLTGSRQP